MPLRKSLKGWVNILWWQIIFWGGLLWDPRRFPSLLYDMTKDAFSQVFKDGLTSAPWYMKLFLPLFLPRKLSVKAVKRFTSRFEPGLREEGNFVMEYLDEISRDDEHHFRKKESALCWDFPNAGAALCHHDVAELAGMFTALDGEGRNWDGVEYMCLGMGSPYCEIKLTPEKSPEFQEYLRGVDASKLEEINERIIGHILSLVLHGKTLQRPSLEEGIHYHEVHSSYAHFSERYEVALRMGGANSGRKIAELLLDSGVKEAETTKHLIDLFQLTKAGVLAVDETVRIEENCESFGLNVGQFSCFFTTGLLNGFFSTVKNQHVKETKCIAAGDPICEWEFK